MAYRKFEAINKFNILGMEYVRLDELLALITEMQKKHREGTEPGYMCEDNGKKVAADLALNHLKVVLNQERIHVQTIERVLKTRFEREAKEQAVKKAEQAIDNAKNALSRAEKAVEAAKEETEEESIDPCCPGRYTVWKNIQEGKSEKDSLGFKGWREGVACYTHNHRDCMWFVELGMAQRTAERLGEGWEVVDMWPVMSKEQRLLRAIFSNDGEDDDG